MVKLEIVLLVKSAAYRNWPLGSMASPTISEPAVNGDPAISVTVPPDPRENAEIVPAPPLETKNTPAVDDITIACGPPGASEGKENGEPATGVNNPLVASIPKTEIVAGMLVPGAGTNCPWFSTTRN